MLALRLTAVSAIASHQDFKSATTGVAAKAMRNELNNLVAGIEDPVARKASRPIDLAIGID